MQRSYYFSKINEHFRVHSVCALLGPHQVGKTTLAKEYIKSYADTDTHFFDLENPIDLARLDNPMLALQDLTESLIVIDEIQRRPELFPVLRVLVDRQNVK